MIAFTAVVLLSIAGVTLVRKDRSASRTLANDRQILAGMMADNRLAFPEADEVDVVQVIELIHQNRCVLVDVRTEAERNVSIIPGAVSAAEFEHATNAHIGKSVVCYCTIGYRSAKYAQAMKLRGVSISTFNGSIIAWCQAGQKLTTPDGRDTIKVHVYGPKWNLLPPEYQAVRYVRGE